MREFRLAGRKLVDAQNVSQNVGVLLPAKPPWIVLRHRPANSFKQVANRQAVPIREEITTGERGCRITARQRVAVARRTMLVKELLAALRLLLCKDAVPHRTRPRRRFLRIGRRLRPRPRIRADCRQSNDRHSRDFDLHVTSLAAKQGLYHTFILTQISNLNSPNEPSGVPRHLCLCGFECGEDAWEVHTPWVRNKISPLSSPSMLP